MLITFVVLITFGPWYSMSYQNNRVKLEADFSLILLYTKYEDQATGESTFSRYWAPKFPRLCKDC